MSFTKTAVRQIPVDQIPTEGSESPVSSHGVFDALNIKADKVNGVVPLAQLPTVDLLQYFDPAYFAKGSNGLIVPVNGSQLPIPSAPITPVIDNTADTFGFTNTGGLTTLDTEKTFNSGTSTVVNTDNPFSVGDFDFPINTVGVRYKATSERQFSAWLWNNVPFTSSSGTPPDDLTPVTNFNLDDVLMDSNDQNFTTGAAIGQTYSVQGFAVNAAFEVRFDSSVTTTGGSLGVSDGAGYDGYNSSLLYIGWARQSNSNGRFQGQINRGSSIYPSYQDFTVAPIFRIYSGLNETVVHAESSFDGGSTWVDFTGGITIPRPAASVLYIKTFFDTAGTSIKNIRAIGLTTI